MPCIFNGGCHSNKRRCPQLAHYFSAPSNVASATFSPMDFLPSFFSPSKVQASAYLRPGSRCILFWPGSS